MSLAPESSYERPVADVALFYGLMGKTPRLFRQFPAAGKKALYVDLGYFGRKQGGRWSGYHKIAVNSRHPNDYYRLTKHPSDRFRKLGVPVLPWSRGRFVMVCGTSDKGAIADGFKPGEWEAWAINEIRKYTDRPIVYRPKPSWVGAFPIPGAEFRKSNALLKEVIRDCHAVVCRQSNASVEAVMLGVPAFCWGGVGKDFALQDLSKIEEPIYPDGRDQWGADIAYTQWTPDEMRTRKPWEHMRSEGLIP